jgi:hypothetical protein
MTDDWRDTRRQLNRGGRFVAIWIIAGTVIVALIGAAWWGIGVATSGVRGQGDGIVKNNSAQNWTAAQAKFEDLYADIVATDRKVTIAAQAKAANPDDRTAADTYLGTVNICVSLVGDYNAEARKFLAADWRAPDLPHQIDDLDPTTDCKE